MIRDMFKHAMIVALSGVLLGLFGLPAVGQVHYRDGSPWNRKANNGPDAQVPGWFYNLGITGMRAELVADDPKVLVIRHVLDKTPASGKIKVGDRVVGVNGKAFKNAHKNGYGMDVFGADGPILELATALEASLSKEAGGKLALLVKRGGEVMEVELNLGTKLGSYAKNFPADCEKSERVFKFLCDYLVENQRDNGSFGNPMHNTFAPLALLASGERKYLPNVKRCLEAMLRSVPESGEPRKSGLPNWNYMASAIVLSEYYLITKDKWALPELNKLKAVIEAGQYLDMSQINPKAKETHPGSVPKGPMDSHGGWGHNPGFEGYGPISMITGQGALAYALMHRCGIKIDRERHDAAYNFLGRGTAANGYVWYGDGKGGGPNAWADMGRTGASGIAFALSPYDDKKYAKRALLHAEVIGKHPESFPDTHGSPAMGMGYAAMAANLNPKAFRRMMDKNRWWFTMAQCGDDGTFYYQPNRDNAGYGGDSRMTASCVVAFIYAIPKQSLVVTGREHKSGQKSETQNHDAPRLSEEPPVFPDGP
jgi:hypothetical protein